MNENILKNCKAWSGSVMNLEDIKSQYLSLTLAKRHYLYKEINKSLRDLDRLLNSYSKENNHTFNEDFESRIDLLTIDLNLIAIDNDTKLIKLDPAVVLLCRLDKNNKKLR